MRKTKLNKETKLILSVPGAYRAIRAGVSQAKRRQGVLLADINAIKKRL